MRLQLPSGRIVELRVRGEGGTRPATSEGALFKDVRALFCGEVAIFEGKTPLDVLSLELRDFHLLRAVALHEGYLSEEAIEITCRNCGAPLVHSPCRAMALGPFLECALGDPELDATLDLTVRHEVPGLGALLFGRLTVKDALPLHRALGEERLVVRANVVTAMGIRGLGETTDPRLIARRLERSSDRVWTAVTNLFLSANYSPRLFSMAACQECGARNDVDAPYDREFLGQATGEGERPPSSNDEPFILFEAFADRARDIALGILSSAEAETLSFFVEGGVAACDDGGDPLLGSYLPPSHGESGGIATPAQIAVFYRTFRAIWDEEGPYDWEAELRETVEHEHEHHLAHLRGDDPVDEEERSEIDREAARIHGKRTLIKHEVHALGSDFTRFLRTTWPLWLILVLVTILLSMGDR